MSQRKEGLNKGYAAKSSHQNALTKFYSRLTEKLSEKPHATASQKLCSKSAKREKQTQKRKTSPKDRNKANNLANEKRLLRPRCQAKAALINQNPNSACKRSAKCETGWPKKR